MQVSYHPDAKDKKWYVITDSRNHDGSGVTFTDALADLISQLEREHVI